MARSSQSEVEAQLRGVEELLAEFPAGIGRAALGAEYTRRGEGSIRKRTLLRRLDELVERGRVVSEGESTARIYRLRVHLQPPVARSEVQPPGAAPLPGTTADGVTPEPNYVPLSREGTEVWTLMRRPLVARAPVGYEREFLDAYVPGETWYLDLPLRTRLHELGRAPDPDRPAGTYARDILSRLLIDLSWSSSRLEGNTYTRLDTQNLIEFGQRAEGSDASQAQMILNHKGAIEYLVDDAEDIGFHRHTLFTLHALLSDNLLLNPADEGRLRLHPVGVTQTTFTPTGIPQVIEECFDLLLAKASLIPDPFEQAFFAMVHLPYLQPFADVNKRMSRLAANIPLIKANLTPLSFVDVPEAAYLEGTMAVYELQRTDLLKDVFRWAYERSCAQYRVIREAIVQPDRLRLRYRDEIAGAVRMMVLSGEAPQKDKLRAFGHEHGVDEADINGFAERALDIVVNLHEGTAGRYRLKPSEFWAWRQRFERA